MHNGIESVLGNLIENGKIPKKAICVAAKMPEQQIDEYLLGELNNLEDKDIHYLNQLSMLLGHGLNCVGEDERLKGIIESLIVEYGFEVDQLSKLLNVRSEILQDVLAGREVDICEKYPLSILVSYLFYALKKPE